MKKGIFALSVVTLLSSTLSFAVKLDKGSSGTTGGGDTFISAFQFIPNSLTVRAAFEPFSDYNVVGTHKHWGLFKTKVYAQEFEMLVNFRREMFYNENKGLDFELTAIRKEERYPIEGITPLEGVSWYLDWQGEYYSFELEVDGFSVEPEAFESKINNSVSVLMNQVDFSDPSTIEDLFVYDQFLRSINIEKVMPVFSEGLKAEIEDEAKELKNFAISVIGESGCIPDKYEQFSARLSQWTLGSDVYFLKLGRDYAIHVPVSVQQEIRTMRQEIYELKSRSIDPFCKSVSAANGGAAGVIRNLIERERNRVGN